MFKLIAALFLSLLLVLPAFANMDEMGPGPHACGCGGEHMGMSHDMSHMEMMGGMMHMCMQHAEEIGLTDNQLAKIKAVHRNMQRNEVKLNADEKLAEMDLMDIMDQKDFDLNQASAAVQKIARIKTDEHLEMLKGMKEVRSMLTEEQYREMKKAMPMGCHEPGMMREKREMHKEPMPERHMHEHHEGPM